MRRQWNLDVIGVPGVEAEAELLAAMITFFQRVGLGPQDVGLKVSPSALTPPVPLNIQASPLIYPDARLSRTVSPKLREIVSCQRV